MPIKRATEEEYKKRFWSYVDIRSEIECWNWQKGTFPSGYGRFKINGRMIGSHRLAWEFTYNKIPKGLFCCHHCDNKLCVNPNHLFLGTPKQNMEDCCKKGRIASGDRQGFHLHPECVSRGDNHYSRLHPELLSRGDNHYFHLHPELVRGENHGLAKLSEKEVIEIRKSSETRKTLAQRYNVSTHCIKAIREKRNWKHVIVPDV